MRRSQPADVRASLPVRINGRSAVASRRAASLTAPESPCGMLGIDSRGTVSRAPSGIGASCSSESTTSSVGPIGGVRPIV
jgi:hypothetical protein